MWHPVAMGLHSNASPGHGAVKPAPPCCSCLSCRLPVRTTAAPSPRVSPPPSQPTPAHPPTPAQWSPPSASPTPRPGRPTTHRTPRHATYSTALSSLICPVSRGCLTHLRGPGTRDTAGTERPLGKLKPRRNEDSERTGFKHRHATASCVRPGKSHAAHPPFVKG